MQNMQYAYKQILYISFSLKFHQIYLIDQSYSIHYLDALLLCVYLSLLLLLLLGIHINQWTIGGVHSSESTSLDSASVGRKRSDSISAGQTLSNTMTQLGLTWGAHLGNFQTVPPAAKRWQRLLRLYRCKKPTRTAHLGSSASITKTSFVSSLP